MAEEITALDYSFEEVGKHVKSSKKRYIWRFCIREKTHTVVCDTSMVSNKIKLVIDGTPILETDIWAGQGFQHKFTIEGADCHLLQSGDRF